jgi:FkbM family methyltransferase
MFDFLLKKYRYWKTSISLSNNDIKKQIRKLLPKKPVILEAGAHVGFDTAQFAMLYPKAIIHAFEPVPDIYKQLEENTQKFSNVIRYKKALGLQNGKDFIYVSTGGVQGSSSLLAPEKHTELFPEVSFQNQIEIETIKMDTWAEQNKINNIDFMWLDMQGYELKVLSQGLKTISKTKAIYMEVNLEELYKGCPLKNEVIETMKSYGFSVYKEYFENNLPYGDILFVKI